jgi:hypothetical protein
MEDLQRSFNQLMYSSSSNLRNDANAGSNGNGDASESLYEEVDVLSPVKADASSYLSGVGDLMISGASAAASNCQRRVSDFLSPAASAASRRASSYSSSSSKPKSMPALRHLDLSDDIVEEVIDDDDDDLEEEVVLDPTEVEYYEEEELEIEEIELDDDLYEELVLPESSAAKKLDIVSNPPVASSTAGPRPASSNTAPTFDDLDDDEDDEDEREPLPSREEVAEAITYIVRQEKVVEYGLMTKGQVDEMNDLPLEEMMEIMKHFEICDNNNATIQWDLVLAMVNPDYSPDAAAVHEDLEDDEDDDQAQPLSASSSRNVPAHHHHRRRRSSGASSSQRSDGDVDEVTEIHAFATSAPNNNSDAEYMMGSSCYSLEVADPSETGVVSNLTAADYAADQSAAGFGDEEDDDDDEYQEETLQGSIVSMDPLIRASYTKSMVELQMSRPARRGKDDNGDGK